MATRRLPLPALTLAALVVVAAVGTAASPSAQSGRRPPATSRAARGVEADPDLSWPPPPAPARIRFLRTLTPDAARGKPSLLARIWKVLVGSGDPPYMLQPYGVAVGPDHRLYVADTFGRALHVYELGKPGYSTIRVDGDSLVGVAAAGNRLFVTDSASGRVLGLDLKGHVLWTLGRKDGFLRPTGIAVGPDSLFVVDTLGNRIVSVSLDGRVLRSFGERGNRAGQFNFPTNIARDADGRLYVTDTMNFRVEVFDGTGGFLRTFGQLGDGSGDFDKPKGVAVDSAGHVYVVEGINDVVQVFDAEGRLLLVFGESGAGPGQFWLPSGITIDHDVVYVADSANRRIEVFAYLGEGQ